MTANNLDDKTLDRVFEQIVKKYPSKRSSVMPALYMAQEKFGWINLEAIEWVSKKVGIPSSDVKEVATFYTMYYKKPVGKYHIQICRTLSCAICGAKRLTSYIKDRLKVASGEVTEDGMWSFEEVECLGSCGTAPMVEINDVYFENLTPESLAELMDKIEKDQPDLRYSTVRGELGGGLKEHPRSQAWTPKA